MKKRVFAVTLLILCFLAGSAFGKVSLHELPADQKEVAITELKKLGDKDVADFAQQLSQYPQITECDMTGVSLSVKAAAELNSLCPGIRFHYLFQYGRKQIDSMTEDLDLDALHLSKKPKWSEFCNLLSSMTELKSVTMYDYTYSFENMETIIAAFPDVDFRWTIRYNSMKFKSGADAYSTLKGRQDPRYTAEDLAPLVKYCPDLLALDVGHNDVSNLSFLSAWPHLKRLIVIDSKTPLEDLSPLADLWELEYIELFMQNITDISPLSGKTALLDLNLCHNNITDLSPLYTCTNLQRLWISYNPNLTQEEIDRLQEKLPDCHIETGVYSSTGAGWREHPRYDILVQSFQEQRYIPFEEEKTQRD